jgi:hypothetical protein
VGIAFLALGDWVRRQTEVERNKWTHGATWPICKGDVTRSKLASEQDRPGGALRSEARSESALT